MTHQQVVEEAWRRYLVGTRAFVAAFREVWNG